VPVLILDERRAGSTSRQGEIHALVDRLAAEGTGVVLISSEPAGADRALDADPVLREGALVASGAGRRQRGGAAAPHGRRHLKRPRPAARAGHSGQQAGLDARHDAGDHAVAPRQVEP